jgi:hypothetical protein
MNLDEVKQILSLYRPGTADETDPDFAEALDVSRQDSELRRWFDDHCALYLEMRAKFRRITVPEGLKEQILAERRIHQAPARWPVWSVVAAAVVLFAGLGTLWMHLRSNSTLNTYRTRMVNQAFQLYTMEIETGDVGALRQHLAQKGAPADFTLTPALSNARLTGGVAMSWENHPVSMVCFLSGQPSPANAKADVWLFVTDSAALPAAPPRSSPRFVENNGVISALWNEGNRTYLLVMEGSRADIGKYL